MTTPSELVDWRTFGYTRKGFYVELGTQMDRGQGSLAFAIVPEHAIKLNDGRLVVWLEEPDREAIACLALHRRKWGFTRDDLELLTLAAQSFDEVVMPEHAERIRALASRIAALLPPESNG